MFGSEYGEEWDRGLNLVEGKWREWGEVALKTTSGNLLVQIKH